MPATIINPAGLHDPVPFGYSHVVDTGALVLVAGQYGSDADGQPASDEFAVQVEIAFGHLATALGAVGLGLEDVVRLGTYIVDHGPEKLAVLGGHLDRIWGARPPAQTLIGVAGLALPGMLFEVDAIALRP